MIKKLKNGKYRLYSKDGTKNLGTYDSREAAEKREKQIQYFKHKNESLIESNRSLSGWLTPDMKHLQWRGSHFNTIKKYDKNIDPDKAVKIGFVWINDESSFQSKELSFELRYDMLNKVKSWIKKSINPNEFDVFELQLYDIKGRITRTVSLTDKDLFESLKESSIKTTKHSGLNGPVYKMIIGDNFGYLEYEKDDEIYFLTMVEIKPEYRNKGYAKELLNKFLTMVDKEKAYLDMTGFLEDGEKYLKDVLKRYKSKYKNIIWQEIKKEEDVNTTADVGTYEKPILQSGDTKYMKDMHMEGIYKMQKVSLKDLVEIKNKVSKRDVNIIKKTVKEVLNENKKLKLKDVIKEILNEMASASITKIAAILGNENGDKKTAMQLAGDILGKNIRPTSLKKNNLYIMRERSIAHHFNYVQDRFPVIFLGVGKESFDDAMKKTKYDWFGAEKNKKLKDMVYGEYYYFKAVDSDLNGNVKKVYLFGAYVYNGSLAIGSGAAGVSLYEVNPAAIKKYNLS